MSVYTERVGVSGLSRSHELIVEAVPSGATVLDVGCASGYLGDLLKARGATTIGVEVNPTDAELARARYDQVLEQDIEAEDAFERLPRNVDVVIFADVLEHLREPLPVLRRTRELLTPAGRVIVSLPNIAHWTARRAVLTGRFPYADFGLFDRTHLRFFTRASAKQFASDAGFRVAREAFVPTPLPLEHFVTRFGVSHHAVEERSGPLREWAAARRPELFSLQFVLTLLPDDP